MPNLSLANAFTVMATQGPTEAQIREAWQRGPTEAEKEDEEELGYRIAVERDRRQYTDSYHNASHRSGLYLLMAFGHIGRLQLELEGALF